MNPLFGPNIQLQPASYQNVHLVDDLYRAPFGTGDCAGWESVVVLPETNRLDEPIWEIVRKVDVWDPPPPILVTNVTARLVDLEENPASMPIRGELSGRPRKGSDQIDFSFTPEDGSTSSHLIADVSGLLRVGVFTSGNEMLTGMGRRRFMNKGDSITVEWD